MTIPVDKPTYGNLDGLKVLYSAVEIAVPTAAEILSDGIDLEDGTHQILVISRYITGLDWAICGSR